MLHAKRWLYLTHRWLGVLLCTVFALWFLSGVVMMYVGYPKLTAAERLAHLPPLTASDVALEPSAALARAGLQGPITELRLARSSGGQAVYLASPWTPRAAGAAPRRRAAAPIVIDARTGEVLQGVSPQHALATARAFAAQLQHGPAGDSAVRYLDRVQEDAFTHSRALDPHRPLHRLALGDAAGTEVYVSGTTGEVVRDTHRTERGWNYLGAWIHWLYPFRGNLFDGWWSGIVNTLSIAGLALTLTGTAVGLMRWRFAHRYKNGRRTPYAGRMMRWHHISGLLFAAITLTWVFSGLMSMNPWKLFDSGAPPLRTEQLHGGALQLPAAAATVQQLLDAAPGATRELRWVQTLGQPLVHAQAPGQRPLLLQATNAQPVKLQHAALADAARQLLEAPVARLETLHDYDLHYFDRAPHTMQGGQDKPLPVLRVVFDDAHATWAHIDLHTGAVLGRTDNHRRAYRWLFGMLHSWDWLPLLQRRPLWDVLLIGLSLGGALLSLTAVVIGGRRLVRPLRRHTPGRTPGAY